MPCYEVTDGTNKTLVRAKTSAAAIATITKPKYQTRILTQDEIIDRLQKGEKVIEADSKDETVE